MLKTLTSFCLGLFLLTAASAQSAWPERPLRLVVGATPGGSNDLVARILGDGLSKVLGQPVVVDNKPGVGASIAADAVTKSPPDGYSILVGANANISINPALDARWAPAQKLVPVTKLASSPLIVTANKQTGFNSMHDLISYARKNPGKLNYSHAGPGSIPHLGGVLFNQLAGIDMVAVPFKGGAQAIQSLLANDTQVTFATPPSVLPQIKAGKLVGLAVSTPERFPLVPDLPGSRDAGVPNYRVDIWFGLFLPEGTPPSIVKKLFEATSSVMKRPEVKAALADAGMEVALSNSSAEFAAFVKQENRLWSKVARDSGVKLE